MRKFLYVFVLAAIGLAMSSCLVPKKKFMAMQFQRDSLQNALTVANIRIDSLNLALQAQKDTVEKLRQQVADLQSKLEAVNGQLSTLSENYKQLRSNSSEEVRKLLKNLETAQADLAAREQRLLEVEDAMRRRDEAVNALKDKLQKALLGFNKSGLTVNVKDGKVYVSLTDKLLFATGSIEIDAKGKEALQELAKVLQTQPDINILVEGHTDNMKVSNLGQMKDNWDLSVMRSTAVVRFLVDSENLDPLRVTASGRGEVLPIEKANTAEARSKNRRIEIILTPRLDELYNLLNEQGN
jgi:chemotaxis protein MotB